MRHSRRAVMAERYKLYAKKNILNSRYLVRNLQIGLLAFVIVAMIIGTIVLVSTDASGDEVAVADAKVSVKDALFGGGKEAEQDSGEVVTEQETTAAATEGIIAEKVSVESDNTTTESVSDVALADDMKKEEPEGDFDNRCIANVDETLNVRKSPSADSEFVGQMNNGAIATVEGTEGEWTRIKSGDVEGYVLTEYVLTGESAEEFAKDYVTLRGTVLEDGVNIRAEKSTDADILTVMDKDDTITVLENPEEEEAAEDEIVVYATTEANTFTTEQATTEAVTTEQTTDTVTTEQTTEEVATVNSEEKTATEKEEIDWIPVMLEDGQTGYVAAELIDIDELYEIAVSAEELQRRADEEAARLAAEEEAARQAALATAQAQSTPQTSNTPTENSTDTNTYEGATAEPVTTTETGECIGTFTITAYCGCSLCGTGSNRTASGTTPAEGRTIAADTSILPFGTQVVIGGVVYTVEDTGSGLNGNHIDIFFATHSRALAFGRKTMKVYKY